MRRYRITADKYFVGYQLLSCTCVEAWVIHSRFVAQADTRGPRVGKRRAWSWFLLN